jgi:hypothetical protein
MKPRFFLVVFVLAAAAMACNMPRAGTYANGTTTPTLAVEVLTRVAQTAQAGGTPTPLLVTATPTGAASEASQATQNNPPTQTPQPCDQAAFVQDVSIPDNTEFLPGTSFTKTWRLQNTGTCTWTTGYALVFEGGDSFSGPAWQQLPGDVAPGATVDVSINMKAPASPGKYFSNWRMRNAGGVIFGEHFYAQIVVVLPTNTPTPSAPTVTPAPTSTPVAGLVYDFAANMCKAQWASMAGELLCPNNSADAKGYVQRLDRPTLENGKVETDPVLLTYPQATNSGAIAGVFPTMTIENGIHFQSIIGCQNGASKCTVKFQVNYSIDNGSPINLGEYTQTYDGNLQTVDIDLSALQGKTVRLVLAVIANPGADDAKAVWVYPRLVKP